MSCRCRWCARYIRRPRWCRTLVVVGDFDAVQNALGGDNLVGAHDQQHVFCCEHAVTGEDVQNGVLAEKGLGKVHKVGENAVIRTAQKDVNSKLLLVFDCLTFCAFASLMWLKRVVLE